jgi:hypothetical protein
VNRLGEAAAQYARHGWHVFPLVGKRPHPTLAAHGFHDATNDATRVRAWWAADPTANIGLHPAPSGLVVLDVDGEPGLATARGLEIDLDDGAETLTCRTGRPSGLHIYYEHPGFAIGNRSLGPSIDVRGDAGYTILPPSRHPSGATYRWVGRLVDLRPVPFRVLELLQGTQLEQADELPRQSRERHTSSTTLDDATLARRVAGYVAKLPWGIPEGAGRNNAAYKLAAWLTRDMGLDEQAAFDWVAAWNARACTPPLRPRELRAVVKSAVRHGRRPVGAGIDR